MEKTYKYNETFTPTNMLIGMIIPSFIPYTAGEPDAGGGWLHCNGDTVNVADYPELAALLGVDVANETTFSLPNLQGEFLRGAGTNSHSGQGNGSTVGSHQDATGINGGMTQNPGAYYFRYTTTEDNDFVLNRDGNITNPNLRWGKVSTSTTGDNSNGSQYALVRPTNTSVNYLIKAK